MIDYLWNGVKQDLKARIDAVKKQIETIAENCGRDAQSVRLVAASKTIPSNRVREAINAGVTILGENYVQEARAKFNDLIDCPVSWHFIGHLQSNKAKYAVRLFDLIHSVGSFKLARELNKQANKINKIQNILIQVNIGEEFSKSGVSAQDTLKLIEDIASFENLSLKGLMTMPPFFNNPEKVRPYFRALADLRDYLQQKALPNAGLHELSMGMTNDFEAAIEEGATLVRIGTAIFGERR